MTKFGYIKVCDTEECSVEAVNILNDEGCEHVFIDRVTRASNKRVEFAKMIAMLNKGDAVLLGELTNLFRSEADLKEKVKAIIDCGADVICLTQPWLNTTKSPDIGNIFEGLLAFEKALLGDRVRVGMEVAKAKGVELGRPTADKSKLAHAITLYDTGDYSVPEICNICDISKSTLYRALRKDNKVRGAH